MSDNIELLPCPFCGSTNLAKSPWIECDNCGAMGPSPRDCDNYPGGWNRRATLAQQPAVVAQEPVAWQVRNGVVTHGFYRSEAEAREVAFDMQKAHSLGGSLAAFNVRPVYTTSPAAEHPDAWTPSGADYDRNIHRNPDAAAWADLFVATFPGLADKHDLMLGWFANAMMAMHDFLKAEQPDTVAVPRELLGEAESIIDSYAEALKASHAPGGDWEGEEAAHDEYEIEAGVASKLRALLVGGAE